MIVETLECECFAPTGQKMQLHTRHIKERRLRVLCIKKDRYLVTQLFSPAAALLYRLVPWRFVISKEVSVWTRKSSSHRSGDKGGIYRGERRIKKGLTEKTGEKGDDAGGEFEVWSRLAHVISGQEAEQSWRAAEGGDARRDPLIHFDQTLSWSF